MGYRNMGSGAGLSVCRGASVMFNPIDYSGIFKSLRYSAKRVQGNKERANIEAYGTPIYRDELGTDITDTPEGREVNGLHKVVLISTFNPPRWIGLDFDVDNKQVCRIFEAIPKVHTIKANNKTYTREQWYDGQYSN